MADHVLLRQVEQFDFALGIHGRLGGHFGGIGDAKNKRPTSNMAPVKAESS